jgi:hypothetical protein
LIDIRSPLSAGRVDGIGELKNAKPPLVYIGKPDFVFAGGFGLLVLNLSCNRK